MQLAPFAGWKGYCITVAYYCIVAGSLVDCKRNGIRHNFLRHDLRSIAVAARQTAILTISVPRHHTPVVRQNHRRHLRPHLISFIKVYTICADTVALKANRHLIALYRRITDNFLCSVCRVCTFYRTGEHHIGIGRFS